MPVSNEFDYWYSILMKLGMALSLYRKKRSFDQTPEPTGGTSSGSKLRFVVQKHAASRLHYDFRLEMEGVLKSWAVPKGPSLNPADKRLAMMVEDHPYDYRNFEGIIPKGNYGAGTVIVWDEGTYEPLEKGNKKEQEKNLLRQLKSGSLKFRMEGSKLKGEFALVKLKGKEDNAWLLIKHRDKHAKSSDITLKNKSVISGKSLETVEKTSNNIYGKKSAEKTKPASATKTKTAKPVKRSAPKKTAKKSSQKKSPLTKKGAKVPFPKSFSPMLATLVDKPFESEGWIYEIKWDGYRAVALCNKGKVELVSRNNKSFNQKFYPVYDALKEWNINAVLDGEVAVLKEDGIAHFGSLQNWRSEADGELIYYLFDIVWLDGYDLKELPLTERRDILRSVMPTEGIIRLSENFETTATGFLATASKMGMEGIMAKKADSIYMPGERTKEWLKIKANKRHEVVIGGYTENEGSSKLFSSLLVGVYDGSDLTYIGKIGTGFNEETQKEILKKLNRLKAKRSPFTETPDVDKPSRFRPNPPKAKVTWVKPMVVCEVSYTEITTDGVMRHPSFEGLRTDKKAKEVVREEAASFKKILAGPNQFTKPVKAAGRKTLLNPTDETQVRIINGHELKFTNLSKIYWPAEKITKRDMLNYYYQVAPYLLPYLKDRPQSLNRFPNGINGKSFYQKDVTGSAPEWIKKEPYTTSEGEKKNFLVPDSEASILYMANAGAIEMNPWNSTIHKEDYPDWCLIDIDPSEKSTFEMVIRTAQVTRDVLASLGIEGYPKTSGSTGIHIYIPLGAKYTYDQCQLFAKMIATEVHHELPKFTSIERLTKNRDQKLYIDYLQNRPKATLAAPYSLRPKPGATVSMPLHWDEVKKGLKMKDFTIHNALDRIREQGDIFKPVLGKGVNISKITRNGK